MGRVAKKAPETPKAVEDSPAQTVTQTRAKRTPKPNPKYANDSVVLPPKIESSESNGSTDIEDKLPETKIVKSTRKTIHKIEESVGKVKGITKAKSTTVVVKKQKIEFDDDEKTKDADEVPIAESPTPMRSTRSGKSDDKSEIKVGEESVAIIDVSSIIAKNIPAKQESPKGRAAGRKRQAQEVVEIKDESPKKKKEEDKPSIITARKSYMPMKKDDEDIKEEEESPEIIESKDIITEKKEIDVKTPISTMKTRRNATTPLSAEPVEKKTKIDDIKSEVITKPTIEPKKLPIMRKEQITKVSPVTLPTSKTINNVVDSAIEPKPAPRLLNSMITPKSAKFSPNVKLAGDGSNKKVFSIDMSDDSLVEKKAITVASPVKNPPSAVKENIAIVPKTQPSVLLKNKLESELNRMKASANLIKRQMLTTPASRQSHANQNAGITNVTPSGARRITKFESWYVIDVKNNDTMTPFKHHSSTYPLVRIANKLKELQLPSAKWDYKVTLQRKQNNNNDEDEEVYTGDVHDKAIEAEKHNFEPNSILFKRSSRESNKILVDRSLMLKNKIYTVTMNGKQCHLVGAPDDIKSLEDLEILLKIVDSCNNTHSCIETAS
ncbi:enolase-phosphatase E1-like [Chironomus tepperi]|uniref:enolase-phosphatase E1-like n=1 Tax=Chironomus tepperi TaxID=113505 RepID=UPI00391F161A